MKSLILPIFLLGLAQLSMCQHTDRFIVNIIDTIPPNNVAVTILGSGTLINRRHVLTAASITHVTAPRVLGVEIFTTFANGTNDRQMVPIDEVIRHPQFVVGQYRANNLAIIRLVDDIDSANFVPRSLGSIATNQTINLFGWGGNLQNPRRDPINVFAPQFCNPTFAQAFCAQFDADFHEACSSRRGSPLIGSDTSQIAGLVISPNCITDNNIDFILEFHSIDQFRSWIQEVSGAEISSKISTLAILSAVLISVRSFL